PKTYYYLPKSHTIMLEQLTYITEFAGLTLPNWLWVGLALFLTLAIWMGVILWLSRDKEITTSFDFEEPKPWLAEPKPPIPNEPPPPAFTQEQLLKQGLTELQTQARTHAEV